MPMEGFDHQANAQRLVACWNALDGLTDEALDGGWNVRSMSAYAKGLEIKLAVARALLEEIAVHAHPSTREPHIGVTLDDRINLFLKGGTA